VTAPKATGNFRESEVASFSEKFGAGLVDEKVRRPAHARSDACKWSSFADEIPSIIVFELTDICGVWRHFFIRL
jgi:hypothetical protein